MKVKHRRFTLSIYKVRLVNLNLSKIILIITREKNMGRYLNNKYGIYALGILALSVVGTEAFAAEAATANAALDPVYNKILGALSGTLGKIIMGVGILLSGVAALAGMNKAVIFTPLGTGIFLGNAKALIEWVFGN
jgi:type IV secretory pathway VirB2 component (pilin)